jgi:5-methylcytosine-specific restriction endonuclease McrBC regulatory subunit McrC
LIVVRTVIFLESRPQNLELTDDEAAALEQAGRGLASDTKWWGDTEPTVERAVIKCVRVTGNVWRIAVLDAVGTVVVGNSLQIVVQPKIPLGHLLYLFSLSDRAPRLYSGRGLLAQSASMWDLVAEWFTSTTARVLRHGLLRDYHEVDREVEAVRGSVMPLQTAQEYYSGRLTLMCRFDQFGLDSPLNRTLKQAARIVSRSPALGHALRQRAYRLASAMDEVGEFRHRDDDVTLERRTGHYRDALELAKHVIRGGGRSFAVGTQVVWSFLLRTPPLVEDGIRHLLGSEVGNLTVRKRRRTLANTDLTLNPDIVVEDEEARAVADVKYKLTAADWKRADLYQIVAFACGFQVRHGAVIEFVAPGSAVLPTVDVGEIRVRHFGWNADDAVAPEDSADALRRGFTEWASSCQALG